MSASGRDKNATGAGDLSKARVARVTVGCTGAARGTAGGSRRTASNGQAIRTSATRNRGGVRRAGAVAATGGSASRDRNGGAAGFDADIGTTRSLTT